MDAIVVPKNGQLTAHNLAIHQHSNPPSTRLTVAAFVEAQNQLHWAKAQRSDDSPTGLAQRDSKLKETVQRHSNDARWHRKRNASHVSTASVNRTIASRPQNLAREQTLPRLTQQNPSRLRDAQIQQPLLHYSRSDSVPLQPRVSELLPQPVLETVQDFKQAAQKAKEPISRQKKHKKMDIEGEKGKEVKRSEEKKRKREEKSSSIIDRNHVLKQRKERRRKNKKDTQSQPKPVSNTQSSNEPSRKRKGRSKGALCANVERLPDLRQPLAAQQRSRMTIEPQASYGIFGKGVSGGSTAARLMRNKPTRDLVFNELKFLDKKRPRKRSAHSRSSRTSSEKKRAKESKDSSVSSRQQEVSTRRPEHHAKAHRDQASAQSRARQRITSTPEHSRTRTQTWDHSEPLDRSLTPGMHSANSIRLRAAKSRARQREGGQDSSRAGLQSLEVPDHQSVPDSQDLRSIPISDDNSVGIDQYAGLEPDRYSSAMPDWYLLANLDPYSNAVLDRYSDSVLDRYSSQVSDRYTNPVQDRYSNAVPELYSTTISNRYSKALSNRNLPTCPDPYWTTVSNRHSGVVPDLNSTIISNEHLSGLPDWRTRAVPDGFLRSVPVVPNRYSPPAQHDHQLDRYTTDSRSSAARSVGEWTERTEPDWRQWSVSSGPVRKSYDEWSPGRSSTVELLRGPSSHDSETRSTSERNELGFSGQWIEELGGPGVWDSDWIGERLWSETESEPDLREVEAEEDVEEEMARLDQIISACGGANEQKSTGEASSVGYLEQDVRVGLEDQRFGRSEWQHY